MKYKLDMIQQKLEWVHLILAFQSLIFYHKGKI